MYTVDQKREDEKFLRSIPLSKVLGSLSRRLPFIVHPDGSFTHRDQASSKKADKAATWQLFVEAVKLENVMMEILEKVPRA